MPQAPLGNSRSANMAVAQKTPVRRRRLVRRVVLMCTAFGGISEQEIVSNSSTNFRPSSFLWPSIITRHRAFSKSWSAPRLMQFSEPWMGDL
eukprot:8498728-Pyramimonas_sp.AAC.1